MDNCYNDTHQRIVEPPNAILVFLITVLEGQILVEQLAATKHLWHAGTRGALLTPSLAYSSAVVQHLHPEDCRGGANVEVCTRQPCLANKQYILCIILIIGQLRRGQQVKNGYGRKARLRMCAPPRGGVSLAALRGGASAARQQIHEAVGAEELVDLHRLRMNGVNTDGAAATVTDFDRLWKKVRPVTFGNIKVGY